MKPQTVQDLRSDSRPDSEPDKVPSAGSRYVAVSRWERVRWFLATLLVVAVAGLVVAVGLTRPAAAQKPHYGEPVPVPPGQITLACPQVPPTVNPAAVDGSGNPLAPPKIAGSMTSTVLARTAQVPEKAVYQPLGSRGRAPQSAAPTPEETASDQSGAKHLVTEDTEEVAPPPENPQNDLDLTPKSAMLYGSFSTPVSGFLTAQPWDGKVALAGADIEQSVSSGDYRGLASAACQPAQLESWLVGGSTEVGESSVLQLMNPSSNSVDAKVEVWGDTGKLDFPRGEKITVPARQLQAIPLESQVGGTQRLVVRVTANGAGLASSLMTHSLLGLTAGGVSLVHASALPSTTQVIPGVAMDGSLGAVRLLNPGADSARATIEVINENGRFPLPGGKDLDLDPGAVLDFTLGGLQPGNYAVIVNATEPVAAGAVIYRQGSVSPTDPDKFVRDLAWLPALSTGGGVVMGPAATQRQLLVTNLNADNREYRIAGATHVVNAMTTVVVPLKDETPQLIEAPDLYVTQLVTTNLGDGDGIDALEPIPDLSVSSQIYVHLTS
ncbi:DUF5719 family protein [uncultured Mobiluncus sp.]|uniref:DUF5719 family protein n=1 Tax=uncultured Mobiluncus sp. TaxID=293425 RepID=UPI0025F44832|nr:DUF5719 family protein [uncultured Mobiluncus sp.]